MKHVYRISGAVESVCVLSCFEDSETGSSGKVPELADDLAARKGKLWQVPKATNGNFTRKSKVDGGTKRCSPLLSADSGDNTWKGTKKVKMFKFCCTGKESAKPGPMADSDDDTSKGRFADLVNKKREHEEATNLQSPAPGSPQTARRKVGESLQVADDDDVVKLFQTDGFQAHLGTNSDVERILAYFYGRNYFVGDPARRKQELSLMIETTQVKIHDRARRFVALLSDGDNTEPRHNVDLVHWKAYAAVYGDGNPNSWNAFRDFGSRWIQRVQLAGTCWVHAAVVTQSYQVVHQGEGIFVIDIAKYARSAFTDEKLSCYIVTDGGGNSAEEFANMLEKKLIATYDHSVIMDVLDEDEDTAGGPPQLLRDLIEHGPALVHCFKVNGAFKNATATMDDKGKITSIPFFDQEEIGNDLVEKHAMTLVGIRKVGGNWRFLLQNWWPRLQLVEVSAQYFVKSEAKLVLATMQQKRIPTKFARCDSVYAEAALAGEDISKSFAEPERSGRSDATSYLARTQ